MMDPWKILYVAHSLLTAARKDAEDRKADTVAFLIDHVEDLIDDAMVLLGGPGQDVTTGESEKEPTA